MGIDVSRIDHNATYGKMTGMVPMDAVSKYPDAMIPRVTVSNSDDALFLVQAIHSHTRYLLDELQTESRRPGADAWELSLRMIRVTENSVTLMDCITESAESLTTIEKD
jgi:hypothetical protein